VYNKCVFIVRVRGEFCANSPLYLKILFLKLAQIKSFLVS